MKNKTGVQYINVQYFKSGDGLCTVCKLTSMIPYDKIKEWIFDDNQAKRTEQYLNDLGVVRGYCGFEFTTTGKVILEAGDNENETYAKRIALTKAQAKAFAKANRIYGMVGENLQERLENLDKFMLGTYNSFMSCTKHVDDLIDSGYEE